MAHDLANQLRGALGPFLGEAGMDPPTPVGPVGHFEEVSYPCVNTVRSTPAYRPRWPIAGASPAMETARGDSQPTAHLRYRVRVYGLVLLGIDEFVLDHYRCSLAKYALTLLKNAGSVHCS